MTPKERAIFLFNTIRNMDSESGKCATCDCIILPVAKFICHQIIETHKGKYVGYSVEINYWTEVEKELNKI